MIVLNLRGLRAEKELREQRTIPWSEIEEATGISHNTIYRHLYGLANAIYFETLEALAAYFDCEEDPGRLLVWVPGERRLTYAESHFREKGAKSQG